MEKRQTSDEFTFRSNFNIPFFKNNKGNYLKKKLLVIYIYYEYVETESA